MSGFTVDLFLMLVPVEKITSTVWFTHLFLKMCFCGRYVKPNRTQRHLFSAIAENRQNPSPKREPNVVVGIMAISLCQIVVPSGSALSKGAWDNLAQIQCFIEKCRLPSGRGLRSRPHISATVWLKFSFRWTYRCGVVVQPCKTCSSNSVPRLMCYGDGLNCSLTRGPRGVVHWQPA